MRTRKEIFQRKRFLESDGKIHFSSLEKCTVTKTNCREPGPGTC